MLWLRDVGGASLYCVRRWPSVCGDLVCSDSWCVAGVRMCMYVGLCGRPRRGGGQLEPVFWELAVFFKGLRVVCF